MGTKSFLKILFRFPLIALAAFDETHIEKTAGIVGIELETFRKILTRFVEAPKMAVGESHKRVGTCGRIEIDQLLELIDGFVRFAGHEKAFTKSGMKIGAPGGNFYAGFKQGNGVLEIILRHAEASEQENNVGIFRCKFVCADKQFESVYDASLIGVNLREEIQNLGRIRHQVLRALENEFGFGVLRGVKVNLPEIAENLEGIGLQRIGLFQFELGGPILFFRSEQKSER